MRAWSRIVALLLTILLPTLCIAGSKLSPDEAKKIILSVNNGGFLWETFDVRMFNINDKAMKDYLIKNNFISATPIGRSEENFGHVEFYKITPEGNKFMKEGTSYLNYPGSIGFHYFRPGAIPGGQAYQIDSFKVKNKYDVTIEEILHKNDIAYCTASLSLVPDNPIIRDFNLKPQISKRQFQFIKYDEGWKLQI